MNLHRTKDIIKQWIRYPQPGWFEKYLIGLHTDSIDTEFTAKRLASESSAKYIIENLRTSTNYETDYDLHKAAVEAIDFNLFETDTNFNNALFLEFGVASGRTINQFAHWLPNTRIDGFDSFEGLPETWTWNFKKGHFSQPLPKVSENVDLHKGWFDATLPKFLDTWPGDVALLHVDCDLYSSATYLLETLAERIVPGTIIIFDEYLNYPGWEKDEFKAWQEFCAKYDVRYEYLGFVSKHQQVFLRVLNKEGK